MAIGGFRKSPQWNSHQVPHRNIKGGDRLDLLVGDLLFADYSIGWKDDTMEPGTKRRLEGDEMARTEMVTITNMCMIYNGNQVLVQDKMDDDYCGITFLGGHVEKGESFTDAVIREVFEETGLKISSPILCGIKDWPNDDGSRYMVLCYKTNQFEGTISSSDEGEVDWMEMDEMKKAKMADGMDKMLNVFLEEHISEYYFCKEHGKWKEMLK
jgi:8-oxo-dGTP diphosphatase